MDGIDDYFELFPTKDEALAFVKGFRAAVDVIDDDHAFVGEPEQELTLEWRVNFSHSC